MNQRRKRRLIRHPISGLPLSWRRELARGFECATTESTFVYIIIEQQIGMPFIIIMQQQPFIFMQFIMQSQQA